MQMGVGKPEKYALECYKLSTSERKNYWPISIRNIPFFLYISLEGGTDIRRNLKCRTNVLIEGFSDIREFFSNIVNGTEDDIRG